MVKWLNGFQPFSHLTIQPFFIMIKYYSVNGQLVPKEKAVIGITDLALLRGYGLFDFFLVKQGHPLFFDDYLDRMENSAKGLRLPIPFSRAAIKQQVYDMIEANGLVDAGLKLVLTGGYSQDGYSPATPNMVILASPVPNYSTTHYDDGIKLMLHEYHRTLPAVKTINYIVGVNLFPKMKAVGAEDILFHYGGHVHETVRANFFIVKNDNTIVTAEKEILKGITRKQALVLASPFYKIEKRPLQLKELETAKEAFITSSTKKVMPVVKIDDLVIGNGKPGKVSKHLLNLLLEKEETYLSALKKLEIGN